MIIPVAAMKAGLELDALVAQRVMGYVVVGECRNAGYDSDILAPVDERCHADDIHIAYVDRCCCEVMSKEPWYEIEADATPEYRATWERINAEHAQEFAEDKARWGHDRRCLEFVPRYSSDISAAWSVIQKVRNWHDRDQLSFVVALAREAGCVVGEALEWLAFRCSDPAATICRAALRVTVVAR